MIKFGSFLRNYYPLLFMAAMSCVALTPVMFRPGWPCNHEGCAFFDRIFIYASHFRQFDLIPIWSSSDGCGMGTPLPLFYHKLFYYPSGMLYAVTGHMKMSLILTLGLFLILGCYGMFLLCRQFNINRPIASIISVSICFLNYTITDWFIRGAMAEFSATMLVPYLAAWSIHFIKKGIFSYSLGLIMFFLFLAHSVIALYATFIILPTIGIVLVADRSIRNLKYILIRSSISLAIFMTLITVYLIPMIMVRAWYDISIVAALPEYLPWNNFRCIARYLYDYSYIWQLDWRNFSIQMDSAIIVFLALSIFACIRNIRRLKPLSTFRISNFTFLSLLFLLTTGFIYLALQLPCSDIFYKTVPGAKYLQFPWRLLSFLQTINLSLFIWSIARLENQKQTEMSMVLSVGLLLTLVSTYPIFKETKYQWFPPKAVEAEHVACATFGIGEYMPNVEGAPQKTSELFEMYRSLSTVGLQTIQGKVDLCKITPVGREPMFVDYQVTCHVAQSVVRIPYSFSGIERIVTDDKLLQKKIKWYRTDSDPCIQVELPAGIYRIRIIFPQLQNLLYPRNIQQACTESYSTSSSRDI